MMITLGPGKTMEHDDEIADINGDLEVLLIFGSHTLKFSYTIELV
jgi:hypothetical protein